MPRKVSKLIGRLSSRLNGSESAIPEAPSPKRTSKPNDSHEIATIVQQHGDVVGADAPPPRPDVWEAELRPVLYQAIHYSTPTYFLDTNLKVIDWNVAFEMIFTRILGRIIGKHVINFIAELKNQDEVFDHARSFTEFVEQGRLPLVDMEPLSYESEKYGLVQFVKVASQLHDASSELKGWSVGLLIRDIEWDDFQRDLLEKLTEDKLWSVYSASYDRVLTEFPPYMTLIKDIISVLPSGSFRVADLGAGTGNVTAELANAGHHVTAVENNVAMLERLRAKDFASPSVTVVKASVKNLDLLPQQSFDAVVMMNVLYAVDDPLRCLIAVNRILKPGGMLSFSTTHSETRLDSLLNAIKAHLKKTGSYNDLKEDFDRVYRANKHIEKTIALRYTRDEYRKWVQRAGFEITRNISSTYNDAVMLIHAVKQP